MLPNFGEFIKSIDPAEVAAIWDSQEKVPQFVQFSISDAASWPIAFDMLKEQFAIQARNITLIYLQQYHQWLQRQL